MITQSDADRAIARDANPTPQARSDDACRIWLYSRDGTDAPVRLDSSLPELGKNHMLWADADLDGADGLEEFWEGLGVEEDLIAGLSDHEGRPALVHHDGIMQLAVSVPGDETGLEPITLHCLVGPNWVVTLHEGELDLVDAFNEPLQGETRLGDLDGPAFLSLVLDWQISRYFMIIERLQGDIDHLDEELLTSSPDENTSLDRLQSLRARVRKLRNTLAPHREVLGLLSHPQSDAVLGADAAHYYRRLEDRLQQAIDAVDTAREMIVGSFDIFMTRTAQATNDIMKRLTIVSVLLLPAVVIAGIMGMNFKVAIFEWPWMFWVTLGLMLALAGATLIFAKKRKWL